MKPARKPQQVLSMKMRGSDARVVRHFSPAEVRPDTHWYSVEVRDTDDLGAEKWSRVQTIHDRINMDAESVAFAVLETLSQGHTIVGIPVSDFVLEAFLEAQKPNCPPSPEGPSIHSGEKGLTLEWRGKWGRWRGTDGLPDASR